jgi:capsule polysaccharide export protein KpsC/LpsZ
MRTRTSTRTSPGDRTDDRSGRTRSELAALVETEARLDHELATARARAALLIEQANARVEAAAAALAAERTAARARIEAEVDRVASTRIRELEDSCARDLARLAAVRGERAEAIAHRIIEQLVAFVLAEDVS